MGNPDITDFAEVIAKVLGGYVNKKDNFWFIQKKRAILGDKMLAKIQWTYKDSSAGNKIWTEAATHNADAIPDEKPKLHIVIVLEKSVELDLNKDIFDVWKTKYGSIHAVAAKY